MSTAKVYRLWPKDGTANEAGWQRTYLTEARWVRAQNDDEGRQKVANSTMKFPNLVRVRPEATWAWHDPRLSACELDQSQKADPGAKIVSVNGATFDVI